MQATQREFDAGVAEVLSDIDNEAIAPPTDGAYTNEIVEAAWAMLADQGLDLFGPDFAPIEVILNEGGE